MYGRDDKKVAADIHDDGGEVRVVLRGGKTLQLLQSAIE